MIGTAAFVVAGAFLAALLRGFTGFGFVMAAVPLLSLALPPAQVVPLALMLQIEIGLIDLRAAVRLCDWASLVWLVPGMVVGTPLGLLALASLSARGARLAIGVLIASAVAMLARGLRLPPRPPRAVTVGAGVVAGAMSGMAGISGPAVVLYLLALPHATAVVRATSIVFFVLAAAVALVQMAGAGAGLVDATTLIWSVAALPALFVGVRLGAWGFRRTSPRTHRRTALIVLSVLAAGLMARGAVG